MSAYVPPLDDILFTLEHLSGLDRVCGLPGRQDLSPDLIRAVLDEAGKLSADVIGPLNWVGDQQGAKMGPDGVLTAEGWKQAYAMLVDGGWNGLLFAEEYGGMELPWLVNAPIQEMMQSANMSFALCSMLTTGAVEAIDAYASDDLKQAYLPKMVTGEWTGTMNLTEAQAGSDLASIRTKAVPEQDHYRITGQKIFISYGDHDLTDNIIHLVLARTPDAPAGVKGISLFIVPKILPDGTRNDARCVSVEHKLGIHASPTAVMAFGDEGGAIGYLIGEENKGLAYMFMMMNRARLNVGIQGLAIAERAYQQALGYAKDRIQGVPAGMTEKAPILHHPDIRRMLLVMKTRIEAMRGVCYQAAAAIDLAKSDPAAQARLDFLTPIAKGWSTEVGQEAASLGVQVHGGMGFVEETGAAQHYRDARITTIYEGTTAIQANDLIGRKTIRDGGAAARLLLEEIGALTDELEGEQGLLSGGALRRAHAAAAMATEWVLEHASKDPALAGAASVNYLMMWGTLLGAAHLARGKLAAKKMLATGQGDAAFLQARIDMARLYAVQDLPKVQAYADAVTIGSSVVLEMDAAQF